MRILHTSDWHLGLHLGGHDRTEELFGQVERICQMAEEYKADVLLVAGDVFVKPAPEVTRRLADILSPYVRRGLQVILVRGNHDKREHFEMMRALLSMEQGESERVHIAQTRQIIRINGMQFAIVPYPSSELLVPFRAGATGTTAQHVTVSKAYADMVRAVANNLEPALPAVFVAHVCVAGVTTPSEKELTYDEGIILGRGDLPTNVSYIALGHIHQHQLIDHVAPCFYSGSIDRMDMGEIKDDKYVLLVDIPPKGMAQVTPLQLEATPFYDLSIRAADRENLPDRYSDLDRAFVRITFELAPGDDRIVLQRRVREICRRCIDVRFSGETASRASIGSPAHPRDYATTSMEYLRRMYADDPDLPELETRTQKLLLEVSDAYTEN